MSASLAGLSRSDFEARAWERHTQSHSMPAYGPQGPYKRYVGRPSNDVFAINQITGEYRYWDIELAWRGYCMAMEALDGG